MEKDYLKGWKPIQEIAIPPVEMTGFKENVIIREPVLPIPYKEEEDEDETVLLQVIQEDEDEEKTVLLDSVIVQGYIYRNSTGEEIEINANPFIIGKSSDCNLVIRNNVTISRRHAQIVKNETGYLLKDLGSSNHTFIENREIENEVQLRDGMIFRLSNEEFEFRLEIR